MRGTELLAIFGLTVLGIFVASGNAYAVSAMTLVPTNGVMDINGSIEMTIQLDALVPAGSFFAVDLTNSVHQ